MNSYTLFIFEGSTERNVTDNLKRYFLKSTGNQIVYASFGHNIYQLYQELHEDPDLSLFELVCEAIQRRNDSNNEILEIDREQVTDIYLFFDYDPHTSNADDKKLNQMLSLFDNSQLDGMLFVNYPMLEAIRHIKDLNYDEVTFDIKDLVNYKRFLKCRDSNSKLINVAEDFYNWGGYTKNIWKNIIEINLGRMNKLVNERAALPLNIVTQTSLFEAQQNKHIVPNNQISVISAFPLMLHDYYGENLWKKL